MTDILCWVDNCSNPADRERLIGFYPPGEAPAPYDPEGHEVVELVCHEHETEGT